MFDQSQFLFSSTPNRRAVVFQSWREKKRSDEFGKTKNAVCVLSAPAENNLRKNSERTQKKMCYKTITKSNIWANSSIKIRKINGR